MNPIYNKEKISYSGTKSPYYNSILVTKVIHRIVRFGEEMEVNIQKIEKIVEIATIRNKEVVIEKYKIFLNRYSAIHKGEQSVLEFLETESNFFPALNLENDEFSLINKESIVGMVVGDDVEEPIEGGFKIHFSDGLYLTVMLPEVVLPAFRSRPIDYFNSTTTFIELSYYDKVAYFNIKKIEKVTGI